MRVFTAVDPTECEGGTTHLALAEGCTVWGVSESAPASSTDEREELEFEALTECVLTAAYAAEGSAQKSRRLLCAAVDIPATLLRTADAERGQWALALTREASVTIAALLVSELSAQDAIASDFAPDMLWFDVSEAGSARDYALGAN